MDITEIKLIKAAEKMVEAIEYRFGEGTIKDGKVNLVNLRDWSLRIAGARELMRILPLYMHSRVDSKDCKIYNKAIIELIMSSPVNMDNFLTQAYPIRYKDHIRDKKGKLISCKAVFVEQKTIYKEIEYDCSRID